MIRRVALRDVWVALARDAISHGRLRDALRYALYAWQATATVEFDDELRLTSWMAADA